MKKESIADVVRRFALPDVPLTDKQAEEIFAAGLNDTHRAMFIYGWKPDVFKWQLPWFLLQRKKAMVKDARRMKAEDRQFEAWSLAVAAEEEAYQQGLRKEPELGGRPLAYSLASDEHIAAGYAKTNGFRAAYEAGLADLPKTEVMLARERGEGMFPLDWKPHATRDAVI